MRISIGHNTGLAKVAVQFSTVSSVVNQSMVLSINICGENRHLRQARTWTFKKKRIVLKSDTATLLELVDDKKSRSSFVWD